MLIAASLAASLALLWTASAHALIHRGHVFGTALETTGANKLSNPSAVAVNEATGETYVVDQGNNRIVRFGPNHEFKEAWGAGVGGGSEYEQCKSEATCKPGIAGLGGPKKPQFDEPPAIAVDNAPGSPSNGDVYVAANRTWKKAIVYKFGPEGKLLGTLISKEEKEEVWPVLGIAVDKNGTVWLEREDEETEVVIERFNDRLLNEQIGEAEEFELPEVVEAERPARPGFEVDSQGRVYITFEPGGRDIEEEEELIEERNEERHERHEKGVKESLVEPCRQHRCYVARFLPGSEGQALEEETSEPSLDPEAELNITGVASDRSGGTQSSGDVYLDQVGSISAFTADGTPIQTFGAAQLSGGRGAGLAVDATTDEVLAADRAGNRIDVFVPEPPGPPTILAASLSAASVSVESSTVKATIDPKGADTHYYFRYGTEPCSSGPSACGSAVPAPPGSDLGAGFGDTSAARELTGLSPATKYYFVAVAVNEAEGKHNEVQSSEEGSFKTLPASTLEAALPDGRAWELVSPLEKSGASIEPLSHEGGLIQAAADGRSLAFIASAPLEKEPPGNRAPELTQLLSSRDSAGSWSTSNISTPNLSALGIKANIRREYQAFSEDLSLAAVFPPEALQAPPATEAVSGGVPMYLRATGLSCSSGPCYEPLPDTLSERGNAPLQAATPDLAHIGFNAGHGLVEWSAEEATPGEGHVRTISVLPNGQAATGTLGFSAPGADVFEGSRNSISANGSLVAWTALGAANTRHIYQSEASEGKVTSIQVDAQNEEAGLAPPTVVAEPVYQTSSVDGERLFFTDDQRLTANASFGTNKFEEKLEENEAAGDLYVFERSKPAGHRLTDLTPDLNSGESSAVQGGVIGASEDGSYVYFVANGVLAPGASTGRCSRAGLRTAKCNLYEVHDNGSEWEAPKLIARISNEDLPDSGEIAASRGEQYKVDEMTARVSPNGQFLAFMSDQRLTGYDNTDAKSGQPDEEVFLFDAQTGHLVCASCNPTGAQPVGVEDVAESGEGRGLLVDRLGIWSEETEGEETPNAHWLAASLPGWTNLDDRESFYQSRYLSNEGRLFFNAADSLVKQDVNGKEDVYEYEPLGVGGCSSENTTGGCVALISSGASEHESAFLDASENGNDVFFLTASSLVPQDTDKAFDIYDARVCSGAGAEEACPLTSLAAKPPCEGEECRPAPASHGTFATPGQSGAPTGATAPQNQSEGQQVLGSKTKAKAKPLTRAQKLAAALKTCRKKYKTKKSKRLACEKQARKKYGAKKASKGKAKKGKKSQAHAGARR